MSNNDKKTIISICPFQTQLVVQMPLTKNGMVLHAVPAPQILKVQCDKAKCELWDTGIAACSVSAIAWLPNTLHNTTDDLTAAIRDIVDTLKRIGDLIE